MSPREIRLLKELIDITAPMVTDLRSSIGALNPAQVVFSLRKKGWDIKTGFINVVDRDGKKCHPGYYWLDEKEKQRARIEIERAARTAPSPDDQERLNSNSSESNHSTGGNNEHLEA